MCTVHCTVSPDGNWTSSRLTSALSSARISQVYRTGVSCKCFVQVYLQFVLVVPRWQVASPPSTSDGIIRHVRKIRLHCRAHGYYQMISQLCLNCRTAGTEHKTEEQFASCAHLPNGLLSVRIANVLLTHNNPPRKAQMLVYFV